MKQFLIVLLGPTAVGKTKVAIDVARRLNSEIISADSRQFYGDLKIGTAAPSREELEAVKHHFVGQLGIEDYYNVSSFELQVLDFLKGYFKTRNMAVLAGGSGLYIDAVCRGIDQLPDVDESLRAALKKELAENGPESLRLKLKMLDPDYYAVVDLGNPNRILRALEVCIMTGKTYSSLRKNKPQKRDFEIIKVGLNRPREELVEIIHHRVDKMIEDGLVEEARRLLPHRQQNALNTVGYKEIFQVLDGNWTLDMAVEKIKTNTRRYAKRQMTWFNKDKEIRWFHPDDRDSIMTYIGGGIQD